MMLKCLMREFLINLIIFVIYNITLMGGQNSKEQLNTLRKKSGLPENKKFTFKVSIDNLRGK